MKFPEIVRKSKLIEMIKIVWRPSVSGGPQSKASEIYSDVPETIALIL